MTAVVLQFPRRGPLRIEILRETARALWLLARSGWTSLGEESARVMQRLSASRTEAA
jgi:hypothetical protein